MKQLEDITKREILPARVQRDSPHVIIPFGNGVLIVTSFLLLLFIVIDMYTLRCLNTNVSYLYV